MGDTISRTADLPKAVTFFGGSRDHYQLPLALAERDLLEAFVTEAYWPFEHRGIGRLARWAIPSSLHSLRHQEGLPSTRVRLDWKALAAPAAAHFLPQINVFRFADRSLGIKGRRIAARTGAPILSCSYYVHAAFCEGPSRPRHRFIFQLHPHPLSGRRILREELERYPWAKASLMREEELGPNTRRFEELCEEPALANGWIAASTFTAQTLSENGIPGDAVHVVSYGVDPADFPARPRSRGSDGPLEVLFLGSMIQRKGLCDLLEGMRRLRSRQVRLTLAGRGYIDTDLLAHYGDVAPSIHASPSHREMVDLMHRSDVLVLPSLLEGFGHVIVEAMSAGLPVIATPHTCAPDLIQNGVEGWIVPIRDPEALADRLAWAADQRKELAAMGEAAARRARELSWQRFRERIASSYRTMLSTSSP